MRLLTLLTCWPPGPPLRLAVKVSSSSGMAGPPGISRSNALLAQTGEVGVLVGRRLQLGIERHRPVEGRARSRLVAGGQANHRQVVEDLGEHARLPLGRARRLLLKAPRLLELLLGEGGPAAVPAVV